MGKLKCLQVGNESDLTKVQRRDQPKFREGKGWMCRKVEGVYNKYRKNGPWEYEMLWEFYEGTWDPPAKKYATKEVCFSTGGAKK